MIVFLIQIVLAAIGTAFYGLYGNYPHNGWAVLIMLACFLIILFILTVFTILWIIASIYILKGTDKKSIAKHRYYAFFIPYVFGVLLRVRIVITGKENLPKPEDGNFIVVSNHMEYSDPVYIKFAYSKYNLAFVAKKELFRIPLIKTLMEGTGCISLDRESTKQGLQAILDTIKAVKDGQPMAIFPEGTRSYENKMGKFRHGAFKIALKANAGISPVCLYDMHGIIKIWRFGIHTCRLHILPFVPYEEIKDKSTAEVSDRIYALIDERLEIYNNAGKS
ncbi:MAG TPA: lysophospholipid acyltransferase family protein [Candidatus Izemoplasmatales bacterium]|nr:lysophospholipid acyltransferase family protein [Candidatus Izemoplasmatales bacterium]